MPIMIYYPSLNRPLEASDRVPYVIQAEYNPTDSGYGHTKHRDQQKLTGYAVNAPFIEHSLTLENALYTPHPQLDTHTEAQSVGDDVKPEKASRKPIILPQANRKG